VAGTVAEESEDRYRQGYRDGYLRALEEWRRDGSPFAGIEPVDLVTRGARYAFRTSFFDSFVDYERQVTKVDRDVQQACWRAWAHGRREEVRRRVELLQQFRREVVDDQLWRVRDAVDAVLSGGEGRQCVVDALRAAPNRPDGVREFPDVEAFVADDRRRALPDWPARRDAGGADYGSRWRLENPLHRWETTSWRLSWLCMHDPTYELYGIELLRPMREEQPRTGRVWLLGRLESEEAVDDAVRELMRHAQAERNSLVAVASAIQRGSADA